jgi:two-component system LytT family response regulator
MNAIIIENEVSANKLLTKILEDYCTGINIVAIGTSIKEGFQLIQTLDPDLVFLDIELDDGQSFDLIEMFETKRFKIIFTTAYDQYALKAFRYDAVDYILKPYTPKTVSIAVNRVLEREKENKSFQKLNDIIENGISTNRLSLSSSEGIRICDIDEIVRLEASSSYCIVHLSNDEKLMVSKTLGDIEDKLPKHQFYRIHASHTVNCKYVKKIINQDGGGVELKNGKLLPLARRRKQEFINQLK